MPKVTALVGTLSIVSEMKVKLAQAEEWDVWCQVREVSRVGFRHVQGLRYVPRTQPLPPSVGSFAVVVGSVLSQGFSLCRQGLAWTVPDSCGLKYLSSLKEKVPRPQQFQQESQERAVIGQVWVTGAPLDPAH